MPERSRDTTDASTRMGPLLDMPFKQAKARFERDYIEARLRAAGGNVTQAAEGSGISRAHFYQLIKKHNIPRHR